MADAKLNFTFGIYVSSHECGSIKDEETAICPGQCIKPASASEEKSALQM